MGTRKSSWRGVLCLFVAVVFAIAAMPGSMAMPAAADASQMAHKHMAQTAMAMPCCDHTGKKPAEKTPSDPCKHMAVCFGIMGCYGLAALPQVALALPAIAPGDTVIAPHHSISGLTIPPDDRPPIA